MVEIPTGDRDQSKGEENKRLLGRRSYLRATGAAVGTAAMSGFVAATGTEERHDIQFETVVNMVEDGGADPTGSESVVDAIEREAADSTLLVFPPGEYLVDRSLSLNGLDSFGMVGSGDRGDTVFVVPELLGTNTSSRVRAVDLRNMDNGPLLENIDFDQTGTPKAKANLRVQSSDRLRIIDVEIHGYVEPETRGSNHNVTGQLYPAITSSGGEGRIERFVARGGTRLGVYKDSETGTYLGGSHRGTLLFKDCEYEGWSDNGIYASRTAGAVQIEGGFFKNNDIANVRISNDRSYVDGATIVIDETDLHGPNEPGDWKGTRAVWMESGSSERGSPYGATIRNCDIIVPQLNRSQGLITNSGRLGGEFFVENCRVRVDADGIPVVSGTSLRDPAASGPHRAVIDGLHVTGEAGGGSVISLGNRDRTEITDSCIRQTGSNRDGIVLRNADGCVVSDTVIDVTGDAEVFENSSVETSGVSQNGSCTVPRYDSEDEDRDGSADDGPADSDNGDGDDSDDETQEELPRTLVLDGADGDSRTEYRFVVDGDIEQSEELSEYGTGGEFESDEDIVVEGFVRSGQDGFRFDGTITAFEAETDDLIVYLDGEEIAIDAIGSSDEDSEEGNSGGDEADDQVLPNAVVFDGREIEAASEYEFTVDGAVEPSTDSDATVDDSVSVNGYQVSGVVDSLDAWRFSGEIVDLTVDDGVIVRVNGAEVDPNEIWGDDEQHESEDNSESSDEDRAQTTLEHTLVLNGQDRDTVADYTFVVDGDVERSEELSEYGTGGEITERDGYLVVDGFVRSGQDGFRFTGTLTSFSLNGTATVTLESSEN